jgi:hypothetical protein
MPVAIYDGPLTKSRKTLTSTKEIKHTKRVLEDGLKWLLEQDNPFRPPEERVINLPPFEIKRT